MKHVFLLAGILILASCNSHHQNATLTKDEMVQIVMNCDKQFSVGVQTKDSLLLTNIYSDSAQYVMPNKEILLGKTEIGKEWAGFLRLKENPIDIILIPKEIRGNGEIIYETGRGYTLLANSNKWYFNYVNVWRVQRDGTYKLEIDTYN